jgi:hypothetical protein
MSRSFRKTPIIGITTSPTDREYKREFQSRSRADKRALCKKLRDNHEYEVNNTPRYDEWCAPKDGKRWVPKDEILAMPHLLRK